ncbi:MAG: hypothetical protein HY207_10935 [Nitrospirae bacterium]|nr:hypothetical protein [Nitrospirota bacterium]
MGGTTLNRFIADFEGFSVEEKEYAFDLGRKQLIEAKRESLAKRAREASANLRRGRVKQGTVRDLYKDLEG